MIQIVIETPNVPAAFVVGEILRRNGNELSRGGRATGQSEHMNGRVAQKGIEFTAAQAVNVWLNVLVGRDWDIAAEVRAIPCMVAK